MRSAIIALLILLPSSALAFQPEGIEQGDTQPLARHLHVARQAELRKGEHWQAFASTDGLGWKAIFNEQTGLPARAWGRGIHIGPMRTPAQAQATGMDFLARHAGLLGVDLQDLRPLRASYVPQSETWYLHFQQVIGDLPVHGATVELRVRKGRLVRFDVGTLPAPGFESNPGIGLDEAWTQAIEQGPAPLAQHERLSARELILPILEQGESRLHRVWELQTETQEPRGRWLSWVDQETGALLSYQNRILFGTVSGIHDTRTVDGSMSTSPMPWIQVSDEDETTYADAEGTFSLDGSSFSSSLRSSMARVRNAGSGGDGELDFTGSTGTWDTSSASQAEVDAYVFVHNVESWAEYFGPDVFDSMGSVIVRVDDASFTCNAYYDGNINTCREGGGCNNTGRIADVIYHEWGHGYHFYASEYGYYADATLSEGLADLSSALQTNDSLIGPYFFTSGGGIRDISSDRVYPDNWYGESHEDSLIFSGAAWDLWQDLSADMGEEEAWFHLSMLVAETARGAETIFDTYDEFILYDDDNADLSDGTPNQCAILEAFSAHGLGPAGESDLISLASLPIEDQTPDASSYLVQADIENLAPSCVTADPTDAVLYWSFDQGENWDNATMTASGGSLTGAIPSAPENTIVQYYVHLASDDGTELASPQSGVINPSAFYVGEATEIYFQDFEESDGDFTHELLSGDDELGADDWQWGNPNAQSTDPEDAWSGNKVWGNDLGYGDWNGDYQDQKHNRLSSPTISVAPWADLVVEFHRWLNVEDGYYDHANVLVDETQVWTNYATSASPGDEHSVDNQWARTVILGEDTDLDGMVTLSWEIESDAGLSMGGWNIDDVRLLAAPTARNQLVVRDFVASDDQLGINLAWTNPDKADLTSVKIIGRDDRFPTSIADGDLLLERESPAPGEPDTAGLATEGKESWFLAAFAVDSAGNESIGAYLGYNADNGTAIGAGGHDDTGTGDTDDSATDDTGAPPPIKVGGGSCGCASSSPSKPAGLLGLGLLSGLLLGRRRSQRPD